MVPPVKWCADPFGYWAGILADIKAGSGKADSASGLKNVQPLEARLDAELKRTTAR